MRKTHICLVGGEDAHKRIELSKYLLDAGFSVTILGTKDYDYPSNINYIGYHLNRKPNFFSDVKTILELRNIFSKNNFDVVQTFDTKPAFLVPLASIGYSHRVVRTITGLGRIFVGNSIKEKVFRFIFRAIHLSIRKKVYCTTFQNTDDRDIFLKWNLVNQENHTMIYGSGIDLESVKHVASRIRNPFTVICISRLIYEKGIVQYLEAAKEFLSDKKRKGNFLLVGPLEEHSKILNQAILEEYTEYVTWLGKRSDVKELLLRSDVFVLPTFYREGFARVLLEASAVGLPLITTNVPGVTDIARHEKEALVIQPKDTKSLVDALVRIYEDEELSDRLSRNALENVKNYSMEVISKNYIDLYKAHEN